jgi:hypothetical protein
VCGRGAAAAAAACVFRSCSSCFVGSRGGRCWECCIPFHVKQQLTGPPRCTPFVHPSPQAADADADPQADACALAVCFCCEQLSTPPGALGALLLRRALRDPAAATARLGPASLLQLARLAGTLGLYAPALASALCARLVATRALRHITSHQLALLMASVARVCGGAEGGEDEEEGRGGAAPEGWDGRMLAGIALRALTRGPREWGGPFKMAHLRIILDAAASCRVEGREVMARQLVAALAEWAALDGWRPLAQPGGSSSSSSDRGTYGSSGSRGRLSPPDPALIFARRDHLRAELHGRRAVALLVAIQRCGGGPVPRPLLQWLLRRCIAPALPRCNPWWVRRLCAALAELGSGSGFLLSAALGPYLTAHEACAGAGGGAAAAAAAEVGEQPLPIDLNDPAIERLLVAVGHLVNSCQQEVTAAGATKDSQHNQHHQQHHHHQPTPADGLAAARAFARRALAALPTTHAALQRLPAGHAAALLWAATRAGAEPTPAQWEVLCAAVGGRMCQLRTDQLLRLAWSAGALTAALDGARDDDGGAAAWQLRKRGARAPDAVSGSGAHGLTYRLCLELSRRDMPASGVSMGLWALSRLRGAASARAAFAQLASRLLVCNSEQLWRLSPTAVIRLASACAQSAWAPAPLLAAVAARGAGMAGALPGPLLAQLVWALAAAGVAHRGLLDASAARAGALVTEFEARIQQQVAADGGGVLGGGGGGGAFTSSKQPEALLLAWRSLRFRPPKGLAARLAAVMAVMRRLEGAGAGGGVEGGGGASSSSSSSSSSSEALQAAILGEASNAAAAAAGSHAAGAGVEAAVRAPRVAESTAGAQNISLIMARRRVVRPVHPGQQQ